VAALGGDKNTYCISGGGMFSGIWGTSASCPVVAAIFARLNAARFAKSGKPLGFLNPWIYTHADAFNDVVVGIIDHGNKKRNGGFEAIKGWDPATGVGTPNWPRMLAAAL
jgi:tripeptidyl-peptidase-1